MKSRLDSESCKAEVPSWSGSCKAEVPTGFGSCKAEVPTRFGSCKAEVPTGFGSCKAEVPTGFGSCKVEVPTGFGWIVDWTDSIGVPFHEFWRIWSSESMSNHYPSPASVTYPRTWNGSYFVTNFLFWLFSRISKTKFNLSFLWVEFKYGKVMKIEHTLVDIGSTQKNLV